MSKASERRTASERIAQLRAQEARRRRQRIRLAVAGAVVVVAAAAVGITLAVTGSRQPAAGGGSSPRLKLAALATLGTLRPTPSPGPLGPEGVPIPRAAPLAGPASTTTGQRVDGIGCQSSEQTLFHIHAHLTIFVNGSPRQLPAGIGIPGGRAQSTAQGPFIISGKCFYWLHTHAADGIIHIESPVQRTYTLGEVFDEWGQPLSPTQAGPVKGHVTVIYDGRVYRGSPRDVPLAAHAQIQLEVGSPLVGPASITWPKGL